MKIILPIAIALLTLVTAYLINQLPEIRKFPGKLWLLGRLTLWLTLLVVVAQVFVESKGEEVQSIWRYGAVALLVALAFDGWTFLSVWRGLHLADNTVAVASDLRERLLKEHHRTVRQRLDYSVGEQALINLVMEPQPEWVVGKSRQTKVSLGPVSLPRQKWRLFKLLSGNESCDIAPKENILETFDHEDIAGRLMILGQPGSGKTITLLKLADALLKRATGTRQIPYIFELSAWRDDDESISDWLMSQLKFDHAISPTISKDWIAAGHLLPLLDGLDELGARQRQCIDRINEFVRNIPGQQVVVCCRSREYEVSENLLTSLNGALYLQPLEDSQIQQYCEDLNQPKIWELLQSQTGFIDMLSLSSHSAPDGADTPLLRIPLFLQILVSSYQPGKMLTSKASLFDAYISRRLLLSTRKWDRTQANLREKKADWAYDACENEPEVKQVSRYLSWLAVQLNRNNIPNNFLIEEIQPSWLLSDIERRKYRRQCSLLSGMLFFLLGILHFDWLGSLLLGCCSILVCFLASGENVVIPDTNQVFASSKARKGVYDSFWKGFTDTRIISFVQSGLLFALCLLLVYVSLSLPTVDLPYGIFESTCIVFIVMLLWIFMSCLAVLWSAPLLGLIIEFDLQKKPNYGVFACVRNVLLITAISYPFSMVLSLLLHLSTSDKETTLTMGLVGGLTFAISFGFFCGGGLAVVQHFLLRYSLYRQKNIPWNYSKFLKYTTERRLTQQVGGRFRFIHRELLDHFAAMNIDNSKTRG